MALVPPPYFESVRRSAQARWEQLEADSELARPWRLLFDQVKNPRHVLSELLQNADDAGATWASVIIREEVFEFRHNGHDFTEEEFRSLCRFGFSNKRKLLTIGFRGIGFRSVFALGDIAEVRSPTLACRFSEGRFTEPEWLPAEDPSDCTLIRVPLRPPAIAGVIGHQVEQWQASPTPLLFFGSIRQLTLNDRTLEVKLLGRGPVAKSNRYRVSGIDGEVLVFRSAAAAFPEECLAEVRRERGDASLDLPPVDVMVVLGAGDSGRLYVVLPTEVDLGLPVSVHAPFVQDPARTRIKQPTESATNSWLLGRVGKLIAESVLEWLEREDLEVERRADAYDLFPATPPKGGGSLSESTTNAVIEAFEESMRGRPRVLCHTGALSRADSVVVLPWQLATAWGAEQTKELFVPAGGDLLAPCVGTSSINKLRRWGLVTEPSSADILTRLSSGAAPPRPDSLTQLVPLWAYLEELISRESWKWREWWMGAVVVPVEGRDVLRPAHQVLPGRSRPGDCEEHEWEFLQGYVEVVDGEWGRLIASMEQEPEAVQAAVASSVNRRVDRRDLERVLKAFRETRLHQPQGLELVVQRAACGLLASPATNPDEAVTLQLIAARHDLPIRLPEGVRLQFLCRDGEWRSNGGHGLVAISQAFVWDLLPDAWLQTHALSDLYVRDLNPEAARAWHRWLYAPEKGGLSSFSLPTEVMRPIYGHAEIGELVAQRGGGEVVRRLQSREYRVVDWDWEDSLRAYWDESGAVSERFWGTVVIGILGAWGPAWEQRLQMKVQQLGYSWAHTLYAGQPRACWLNRLRDLPCLPDEHGRMHVPAELLRRTPSTLPLLNVEPFVHERWDEPGFADGLDALGVRSSPLSAGSLVERLRAHSGDTEFPTTRLMDLYRAIDRLSSHLDEGQQEAVRTSFEDEPLVRTASGWERSRFVYLENPHGIPAVAEVHPDLRHLVGFWERLGLRREPGLDDALAWLESLPLGEQLGDKARGGVRAILTRYPDDVWKRLSRWLDVQGRLEKTAAFRWGCSDRRLTVGLFPAIKIQTADLSMVDLGRVDSNGLDLPPRLERLLTLRVVVADSDAQAGQGQDHSWLRALGRVLARLQADGDVNVTALEADCDLGRRLAATTWSASQRVRVQFHLDGTPAGPETDAEVAWDEDVLHVCGTLAGCHRAIVKEIARHFLTDAAQNAIRDCVGRDLAWIAAYADSHLLLEPDSGSIEEWRSSTTLAPVETMDTLGGLGAASSGFDLPPADAPTGLPVPAPAEKALSGGEGAGAGRPETHAKPKEPTKLDRFAAFMAGRGFRWDAASRQFVHPDGGRVMKSAGLFPWVLISDGSERGIWLASSCLSDHAGLEIPAEVWAAGCHSRGLLLEPCGESLTLHSFADLHEETLTEAIGLFPSSFRLKRKL